MRIKSLLLAIMLLFTTAVFAAPFQNVEKILTQPDGTKLYCFASGDEFYSRLHDAEGYTIVQAENGYFVYATSDGRGSITPTTHIAGITDPKSLGIKPNIMISQEEYQKRRKMMEVPEMRDAKNLNHGVYNNLVIFIKFKGDGEFMTTKTEIDSMFNYDGYYDISMNNYFKKATYNQLSMESYCYPIADGDRLLAYEDIYPRNYYQPYNPTTNPDGYTNQAEREFPLLKRAVEYVADQVPADLDIDRNNDGYIDNVIFVVKGNVGDWSDLLWPHMWSMYGEEAYINGKRVGTFNFQLETSTYFSVSTLCHEMSHSLGFPDLYHYNSVSDHLSPAGPWDLMCGNASPPQHSSVYMKYKYGTWIDRIPEIKEYGTYTLEANSWEGGRRNCYKIASSDPDQYYFIEFRNKNNFFEKGIPSAGIIISRIDTRFRGCADHNGYDTFDEVYIFRPGGSYNKNGSINAAAYNKDYGKTVFNYDTDPYPFLNKNTLDFEFNITDVSYVGDQMTFTYRPLETDLDPHNLVANVNSKDGVVELKWDASETAQYYNVYRDGVAVAQVEENYFNDKYDTFDSGRHEYYVTAQDGNEESYRTNIESVITGKYLKYAVKMHANNDHGWQGAEIKASFDNGMDEMYFTMYSPEDITKTIVVPEGTKITLEWVAGWDDSECSFVVTNKEEEIYVSSELTEGFLTEIMATGDNSCMQAVDLLASVNDGKVNLTWRVMAEVEKFTVLRDGVVIAENITDFNYVDEEVPMSGSYKYTVISVIDDYVSAPSEECFVSVMKSHYDTLQATATVVERAVTINWSAPEPKGLLRYDDGEYVTNIGSNTYNWAIIIPSKLMTDYRDSKLSYLEMFDACDANYTFKIYNGEKIHDSVMIFSGMFETHNTNDYVRFDLGEIPFNPDKDLWIVAKSSGASTPPIPCGKYVGDPNSGMIKAGSKWVPALEYGMEYSWMLRAYVTYDGSDVPLTYNIYKGDMLLASDLTTSSFTTNAELGTICYKVKAYHNELLISESDTLCVTTQKPEEEEEDFSNMICPNPVKDYLTIKAKDIINIKIFSATGAMLLNEDMKDETFTIDMKVFRSGTYIIHITTKDEVIIDKITKY